MADHYIEALADWAEVTGKPLFGAIALRRADLVFGMIDLEGWALLQDR